MKLFNKTTLIIFSIVLIVILYCMCYNLYYLSNYDTKGNKLNFIDTILNMFGKLNNNDHSLDNSSNNIKLPLVNEINDKVMRTMVKKECKKKIIKEKKKKKPKKEVFNIDNNVFTYEEAECLCKAYDSELATYDQLMTAHKNGANWCNYGWSANGMALYPIQQDFYDEIQNSESNLKNKCGKPGVNGGIFTDKEIKFGVNCYGFKPKPDKDKIVYNINKKNPINVVEEEEECSKQVAIKKYKNKIKSGLIEIRPFSDNKWSKYSCKKSSYILSPKFSDIVPDEEITQEEMIENEIEKEEISEEIKKEEIPEEIKNNVNSETIDVDTDVI